MAVDGTELRKQRDLRPETGGNQTYERSVQGELGNGVLCTLGQADDAEIEAEQSGRADKAGNKGPSANRQGRDQGVGEGRHGPTSQRSVRSGRSPTPVITISIHFAPARKADVFPSKVSSPSR